MYFPRSQITPSIQTSSIHPYPKISHPSATFRFLCAFLHTTCPVPIGPETLTFKPQTRSLSLSRFLLNPIDAYFPGANPTPDQGPLTGLPLPSITFFLLNPESLNPRPPPSSVNSAPHRGRLYAASLPPQAAPPPPGAAGQGPLRSLAVASAVGRAVARPRRAGTVPAEAAPPPPGARSGAGAGRLAGPTSGQPGRGRPQNGGRARWGRGRACDRARASHLDAEARASLSPQRWLRRRRALLTRFSPPPTGRRRADRQRRAHWLRPLWRQRVPTAPRGLIGWRGASFPRLLLIGSRAHPSRENRSPSTLLQPPTPKPGFPPARGLTANGGTERGRWVGGWAVWWGEAQPMGARRTSRLSSAAPGHSRA